MMSSEEKECVPSITSLKSQTGQASNVTDENYILQEYDDTKETCEFNTSDQMEI